MVDERPYLKRNEHQWALTNWGNLRGVFRTRTEAREEAEASSGEPWKKCRKYFEIRRVTVTEGWR